jgi:hypothetical protein
MLRRNLSALLRDSVNECALHHGSCTRGEWCPLASAGGGMQREFGSESDGLNRLAIEFVCSGTGFFCAHSYHGGDIRIPKGAHEEVIGADASVSAAASFVEGGGHGCSSLGRESFEHDGFLLSVFGVHRLA